MNTCRVQQLKDAVTDTDDTTSVFHRCHNYKIIIHKFHHRPNYSLRHRFSNSGSKNYRQDDFKENVFVSYIKKKKKKS